MNLDPEQLHLLPSDEDVAFYQEHGWYISKRILSDDVIETARIGARRHFMGDRDTPLPFKNGYSDWTPDRGDNTIRNCEYAALQTRELLEVVKHPLIGAIAARLSGCPVIRLWDDQLLYKPPDSGDTPAVIGWHVDMAYWSTCTSTNMLTAWVPFHDCDEEMGTLMVVDGSHKWPASNLRGFNAKDFAESEKPLKEKGQYAKIPMNLKKGQVSFHHCLAVHGSDRNRSASPRVSLAIHLQDGANRYREYITEKGVRISLFNDKLCRHSEDGTPDYTDPKVFPVLWGTPI